MAGPLYKRYVPSSKNPASAVLAQPVAQTAEIEGDNAQQNGSSTAEGKRKRERSEEEAAERKAKKLRKKGVGPSQAQEQGRDAVKSNEQSKESKERSQGTEAGSNLTARSNGDNGTETLVAPQPVQKMSMKKRHKLEKEARKARKEEARAAKEQGESGSIRDDEQQLNTKQDSPKESMHSEKRGGDGDAVVGSDEYEESHAMSAPPEIDRLSTSKASTRTHQNQGDDDAKTSEESEELAPPLSEQPRKRRHKLESVLQQESVTEEGAESGQDRVRKYGNVLNSSVEDEEEKEDNKPVLHDLEPLPQPEKATTPEFHADASALPQWLARPTIVSDRAKSAFSDLDLNEDERGYGKRQDDCVSAAHR
ncbi:hypothetical protein KC352_g28353 [Hortaea werneckii]|nr:hypothetical protein KC352_g28353 [Hortaea werneckii]